MLRFTSAPLLLTALAALLAGPVFCGNIEAAEAIVHRSPVAVVLGPGGDWIVTANQTSGSLSLVDTASQARLDELACGEHPADIALCLDGKHVAVSCTYSGQVAIVQVQAGRLRETGRIDVGLHPLGLAVTPDGKTAYVGLTASGEVAQLDLESAAIVRKIAVGAWPRYLAFSPSAKRLAVGCSGDGKIVIVDVEKAEVAYEERLAGGINLGHMQCSADGEYVYFPWMVYRSNPITSDNIQRGWVLASRIGRVRLDGPAYREAISLDVPGLAVADPHGLVMSPDERRLVVSAAGTHELLVYRRPDLPFIGAGGPSDLIERALLDDRDLFYRIELGGRPMGLAMADDGRTVYVSNYLRNSVQVVDIEARQITREITLGPAPQPTPERRGMEVFYDGRRSLDQWYSCHTCHYDGGINSRAMDTLNDGSELTMKTVLPLIHLERTAPWTWHGWQTDLRGAMQKSFTETMQGKRINGTDTDAMLAFLASQEYPPNPFRAADGSLSAAALRGQAVFESSAAGCASCHSGPHFTDGKIHQVGLESIEDAYDGFNTPSLLGVYRKVRFLHDGRAKSLEAVLSNYHAPADVAGEQALTAAEQADLIEYLKSL